MFGLAVGLASQSLIEDVTNELFIFEDRISVRDMDADMRQDIRYGYHMLGPIEIWRQDRFADSAAYVRDRLKTPPGKQREVGREFNRRMKKVFAERGIHIPFPHRTLYWGKTLLNFRPARPPANLKDDFPGSASA